MRGKRGVDAQSWHRPSPHSHDDECDPLFVQALTERRDTSVALASECSFVPFLRGGARSGARVDQLTAVEPSTPGDQAITEIFSAVSSDKPAAARKILGYLSRNGNAKALLHAANRLIFLKGNDSHDYKFSAAVLEDFNHLSPMWRERYLAASVFWLNGSGAPENDLVERARRALVG